MAIAILGNRSYFWQVSFGPQMRFGALGIILPLTKKTVVCNIWPCQDIGSYLPEIGQDDDQILVGNFTGTF